MIDPSTLAHLLIIARSQIGFPCGPGCGSLSFSGPADTNVRSAQILGAPISQQDCLPNDKMCTPSGPGRPPLSSAPPGGERKEKHSAYLLTTPVHEALCQQRLSGTTKAARKEMMVIMTRIRLHAEVGSATDDEGSTGAAADKQGMLRRLPRSALQYATKA